MSERVGRKPLATGHVDTLAGSTHAKSRLRVFLETLRGEMTVPEACQVLGIGESQFHWARGQWLQEALELLEPRALGRPRRQEDYSALEAERNHLLAEKQQLQEQLQRAELREELARILNGDGVGKKTELRPKAR